MDRVELGYPGFEPSRTEVGHLFGDFGLARLAPDHRQTEQNQPDEREDPGHAEVAQILLDVDIAPGEPSQEDERAVGVGA